MIIYKPHPYIANLELSKCGKARTSLTKTAIKVYEKKCRYTAKYLKFYSGGKTYFLHKAVAETWLPNPNIGIWTEVDHIDRNPRNCNAKNLRWCSRSTNQKNRSRKAYAGRKMLFPEKAVPEILKMAFIDGLNNSEIAKYFPIKPNMVSMIINGKRYAELSKQTQYWPIIQAKPKKRKFTTQLRIF